MLEQLTQKAFSCSVWMLRVTFISFDIVWRKKHAGIFLGQLPVNSHNFVRKTE